MSAVISECGKYRYVLTRSLDSIVRWYRPCLFIMLNPSTADANIDDPTIRRCIEFGKRQARTHLTVVNLYAYRATNPKELKSVKDPVGPDNHKHVHEQIEKHKNALIIAAWGNFNDKGLPSMPLDFNDQEVMCLGKNKNGSPKHPLYLRADSPLILLNEPVAAEQAYEEGENK